MSLRPEALLIFADAETIAFAAARRAVRFASCFGMFWCQSFAQNISNLALAQGKAPQKAPYADLFG